MFKQPEVHLNWMPSRQWSISGGWGSAFGHPALWSMAPHTSSHFHQGEKKFGNSAQPIICGVKGCGEGCLLYAGGTCDRQAIWQRAVGAAPSQRGPNLKTSDIAMQVARQCLLNWQNFRGACSLEWRITRWGLRDIASLYGLFSGVQETIGEEKGEVWTIINGFRPDEERFNKGLWPLPEVSHENLTSNVRNRENELHLRGKTGIFQKIV